jgi:hypothetical protein
MTKLFAVFNTNNTKERVLNLTWRQAIQHILRDDGQEYRLEPEMRDEWDDDGVTCRDVQKTLFDGTPVWRVLFKDRYGWGKSNMLAFGDTEGEAENEFLDNYKPTPTDWDIIPMSRYEEFCQFLAGELEEFKY